MNGVEVKVPLIKNNVRILRPSEYKLIHRNLMKRHHKIFLDTLLFTGMRYVEAQRLQKNPDWFDEEFIHMPNEKYFAKRRQMDRVIKLTPRARQLMPFFLESKKKLPTKQTWGENLKRWAKNVQLNPIHLCAKTSRKTFESWLLFYYPNNMYQVASSQGHTSTVSLGHYMNVGLTEEDRIIMKEFVEGWL